MPLLPMSKQALYLRGCSRVKWFCQANEIPIPSISTVDKEDWHFGSTCAYYRSACGIVICLQQCANPCSEGQVRNWNWPGSTTDREPFGVLCHELGHHCDWTKSERKGSYYGDYGVSVMKQSGEKPITGYCPNPAEWFAEMFRLFVTNHALLRCIRPKAWELLSSQWKPVSSDDWRKELGDGVPARVIQTLINKGAY